MRNPQIFQQFQKLQKSQNNPEEILKGIMEKYTPEQKEQFMKFANNFGVTNEQLSNFGITSNK